MKTLFFTKLCHYNLKTWDMQWQVVREKTWLVFITTKKYDSYIYDIY